MEISGIQEIAHLVTQDTRHKLLVNILAHPSQSPSLDELCYTSPDKSRSTIAEHLDTLTEYGVVEKLIVPAGSRSRSLPHTFYRTTDIGQKFLAQHDLVPVDDRRLQSQYARVEKPDKIIRYEEAPRHDADIDIELLDEHKRQRLANAVEAGNSQPFGRRTGSKQQSFSEFADKDQGPNDGSDYDPMDGSANQHPLHRIYGFATRVIKDAWSEHDSPTQDRTDSGDEPESERRLKP